jgi:tryptophanyl-tRNA synthetase
MPFSGTRTDARRAQVCLDDPTLLRNIIEDGCDRAQDGRRTMRDVRDAMGLAH